MLELCDWPIDYSACGAGDPVPPIEPVTLTWASGWTLRLSREAEVVTAVLTVGPTANTPEALPLPAAFGPRGTVSSTTYNDPAVPTLALGVSEIVPAGIGVTAAGSAAPATVLTAQWLADPAETPSTGCGPINALTPSQRANFERMAGEMLWNWSDRVFGLCDVKIRPCRSGCTSAAYWRETFWGRGPYPWMNRVNTGSWVPLLIGGQWYNLDCGCAGACSCAEEGPTALRLPGPVESVSEVKIDGEVLPPSAYQVLYNRVLVRLDGKVWPACQDLMADSDKPNTFEVSYRRGVPVPTGGQVAAGILACELAKAACNDGTCQLPQRIQTLTRQGVTIGFNDDFSMLDQGKTGIWVIDSWTASVRKPPSHAGVRSPDYKGKREGNTTTWPSR